MIVHTTAPNQITLPPEVFAAVGSPASFSVVVDAGRLILTPAGANAADQLRGVLEQRGVTEADVNDAVEWARR